MKTSEIRQKFIEYFVQHGHTHVPSGSLVPTDDPTLLFTNAGMVPFKKVFLGEEPRAYKRAVTCQRCVRAGGKHNDLANVGYTNRHHTFFEMLGNFSFGDYFKEDAIKYAWEFLTSKNWLNIPAEKLWVTVHHQDNEAAKIWLERIGINPTRFSRCGDADNFWAMGETGPCGYCSEIYYDHGESLAGKPPGHGDTSDRYIEIWNLVFMQFNRDLNSNLTPLPNPSIDTGMGLERMAAVMQNQHDNYQIDIFQNLQAIIRFEMKLEIESQKKTNIALRVISDHIRATVFLIADGIIPSNEGRGYVLRGIIRRAIYFAYVELNYKSPFLFKLVKYLTGFKTFSSSQACHCEEFMTKQSIKSDQIATPRLSETRNDMIDITEVCMNTAYPELNLEQKCQDIEKILRDEEEKFSKNLDRGLEIFKQEVLAKYSSGAIIPGEVAFNLHDTYGFPKALADELARQNNLKIDDQGFEELMTKQRQRARAASKFKVENKLNLNLKEDTQFSGYQQFSCPTSKIIALFNENGNTVDHLDTNQKGIIVLNITPFYAESGGQVGDTGIIAQDHNRFTVTNTQKQGTIFLHYGIVENGSLARGTQVQATIDVERRLAITANHSAAHLLHKVLQEVLGSHVKQQGSSVDAERLRLDFAHFNALTDEQVRTINYLVNTKIWQNLLVKIEEKPLADAYAEGVTALFGEKYGEMVRVVTMGNFSKELCGGTHVNATGEIGIFRIITESAIASGIRRIVAITRNNVLNFEQELENKLNHLAILCKTDVPNLDLKVTELVTTNRELTEELGQLKSKALDEEAKELLKKVIQFDDLQVLVAKIDQMDINTMRNLVEKIKQQIFTIVIVLTSVINGKIQIVVGVSKNCEKRLQANQLMQYITSRTKGKGGGKADIAQGGGGDLEKLDSVLQSIVDWIKEKFFSS